MPTNHKLGTLAEFAVLDPVFASRVITEGMDSICQILPNGQHAIAKLAALNSIHPDTAAAHEPCQ